MKSRFCLLIFTLIGLSLTSCSQPKSSQEIAETVNKSLVLIYYENQGGHGTGFIVPGKKGVCTVLTAGHVVKGYSLKLQTYQDKQSHTTDSIQTSPNFDLAVVTFKSGETCPYPSVNFGNSNELKVGQKIYISGFPVLQNEDLAPEFLEGSVSKINVVLPEGYGINYTAQVSVGISGALHIYGMIPRSSQLTNL
jgi:S1-C subfamily serine protease